MANSVRPPWFQFNFTEQIGYPIANPSQRRAAAFTSGSPRDEGDTGTIYQSRTPLGGGQPVQLSQRALLLPSPHAWMGWMPEPADFRDKTYERAREHMAREYIRRDSGGPPVQVGQPLQGGQPVQGGEPPQGGQPVQRSGSPKKKRQGAQAEAEKISVHGADMEWNPDQRVARVRTWNGWMRSQARLPELFQKLTADADDEPANELNAKARGARKVRAKDPAKASEMASRYREALSYAFPGDPASRADADTNAVTVLLAHPPQNAEVLPQVDLRPFMSPIENQGRIGSCTAQTIAGLAEYLQIVTRGAYVNVSRLFLYKATRNLLGWTGDTGAYIRSTIKALRGFGFCPEEYYPYIEGIYDAEPPAFCYAFGSNFKNISYYTVKDLTDIKRSLSQGYPVAFGFSCFESLFTPRVQSTGVIPYPGRMEAQQGGHAVLAVGYVDKGEVGTHAYLKSVGASKETGYVIIRNSWGTDWGEFGYGYLPETYFLEHQGARPLADDFWTMTELEFEDLVEGNSAPLLYGAH